MQIAIGRRVVGGETSLQNPKSEYKKELIY
jgi:hypothetical protein